MTPSPNSVTSEARLENHVVLQMLRAHYELQRGSFISDCEESNGWVHVASRFSPAIMWNHSAWIGSPTELRTEHLLDPQERWRRREQPAVVYLVADEAAHEQWPTTLAETGFRRCDQEVWLYYDAGAPVALASSNALDIRLVENRRDFDAFLGIFLAAYQVRDTQVLAAFQNDPSRDDSAPVQLRHYVAYAAGEAVCAASLYSCGDHACIYNVGTLPAAQGRGYARQLVRHLLSEARPLGLSRIFLQSTHGSKAERLYRQLGFAFGFARTGYRADQKPSGKTVSVAEEFGGSSDLPLDCLGGLDLLGGAEVDPSTALPSRDSFPCGELEGKSSQLSDLGVRAEAVWTAAWALLLSRYGGQTCITFGLRRGASGIEPVHLSCPGDERIHDWLKQVEAQIWNEPSTPENREPTGADGSGFESVLAFAGAPSGKPSSARLIEWRITTTDAPEIEALYDTRRLEARVVRELGEQFLTLLDEMRRRPQVKLTDLNWFNAEKRSALLQELLALPEAVSDSALIPLFREQVQERPSARGVLAEAGPDGAVREYSYQDLDRWSNRVAHILRGFGVGPERVVGLCLERSAELVAYLLGTLKAGAVCLPLDPAMPRDRIDTILQDVQPAVVITEEPLGPGAAAPAGQVVTRSEFAEACAQAPEHEGNAENSPEDAAYIIFTSGSTGKPKGVVVPHRAVAGHCLDCVQFYGLQPGDRVLQFNSFSFDAAFEQILATLISGATLVLRGPSVWTSSEFKRRTQDFQLTVVDLPTAYWHQLLTDWKSNPAERPDPFPRLVIVGGEAMLPESVRLWAQVAPSSCRLVNAYGPTEATITATAFEITPAFLNQPLPRRIPIGRPRGQRTALVLDSALRPVPRGAVGQLYLGGPWLARGYLNRPQLTQERFVPNPFAVGPGERLYQTGDLVRYRVDGNLEFLGRGDRQIKLRGFRIELDEIEAVLRSCPGVRDGAVVVRKGSAGEPYLAAYYVTGDTAGGGEKEIRQALERHLPGYMVPSVFRALESLPLLPSGKVDRGALPIPEMPKTESAQSGPRRPMELQLLLLFERVLRRTGLGIRQGFFELGGDSLQALELLVAIERVSARALPMEVLYQSGTVEALAALLEGEGEAFTQSSLVPLQVGGRRPPVYFVHTTPGDILGYGSLIYHLDSDQPCYGLQSLGLIRPEERHPSIEAMAAYYVQLLRGHQAEGPYFLAGWCYGGLVAVEMARRLREQGERVAFVGLFETVAPAPGWRNFRYYAHRLGCALRMRPSAWPGYLRAKIAYYRDLNMVNRMRFRRVDRPELTERGSLDEHNRRLERLELVYNTNLRALRSYRPLPYPGRVTLFNAEQVDSGVVPDPLYAWPGLAKEIEVHTVPGDHDSMLTEPNVIALAQVFSACLLQAQSHARPRSRPVGRSEAQPSAVASVA